MLPDKTTLQLFEAIQDQQITTAETAGMMTTVFSSAISGMVMVFGVLMFNKVLKHNPGNPTNYYRIFIPVEGASVSPGSLYWRSAEFRFEGTFIQTTYTERGLTPRVASMKYVYSLQEKSIPIEVYAENIKDPSDNGRYSGPQLREEIVQGVTAEGYRFIEKLKSGNPGNPDGMTPEIISRAGMKEYEYRYFPPPEEERKPRVYAYTRRRTIGSYEIQMTRTDDSCMIKLYEFLPGWKRSLRATWTGIGIAECDRKFLEVVETVIQVRFEHKTGLMR